MLHFGATVFNPSFNVLFIILNCIFSCIFSSSVNAVLFFLLRLIFFFSNIPNNLLFSFFNLVINPCSCSVRPLINLPLSSFLRSLSTSGYIIFALILLPLFLIKLSSSIEFSTKTLLLNKACVFLGYCKLGLLSSEINFFFQNCKLANKSLFIWSFFSFFKPSIILRK